LAQTVTGGRHAPYRGPVSSGERRPNASLRRARGTMSQERLADLVNAEILRVTGRMGALTSKSISDWERGWYSWPAKPSRDALCAVLGVGDPEELGFNPHRSRRVTPSPLDGSEVDLSGERVLAEAPMAGADCDEITWLPLQAVGRTVLVPLNRRSLLRNGALTLIGAASGAAAGAPRRAADFDPKLIEHLLQVRQTLVTSDSMLGAKHLVQVVLEQITRIEESFPSAPLKLRAPLFEVASAFAELAGWLLDDVGDTTAGSLWSDRALDFAHAADNDVLIAYTLMRKAQQATLAGDAARTIGLAKAASRQAGSAQPRVLASALQQQAHGHAADGEESATLRTLDAAYAALDQDVVVQAPLSLASHCTPEYLHAQRGACMLRLGHPQKAVDAFDDALGYWPYGYRREQGLHMARKAVALASADEPTESAAVARGALRLASATGSARVLDELRSVASLLGSLNTRDAEVATFRTELAHVPMPDLTAPTHGGLPAT